MNSYVVSNLRGSSPSGCLELTFGDEPPLITSVGNWTP